MNRQALLGPRKQVQTSLPVAGGFLQRKCDKCRKKRSLLQRSAVRPAPETVPSIVHEVLRSPGQPLDAATRSFMEPRFGHDFSRVKVHTDARAAESALALNALAYTVGRDVVFGAGKHRPGTESGRRLLGHELAHVVQQREAAGYQGRALQLGEFEDALEHQAKEISQRIDEARSLVTIGSSRSPVLQREEAGVARSRPAPVDENAQRILLKIPLRGTLPAGYCRCGMRFNM